MRTVLPILHEQAGVRDRPRFSHEDREKSFIDGSNPKQFVGGKAKQVLLSRAHLLEGKSRNVGDSSLIVAQARPKSEGRHRMKEREAGKAGQRRSVGEGEGLPRRKR